MCPGVYGYSYDDGIGLITCEATSTYSFTVGCPATAKKAHAKAPSRHHAHRNESNVSTAKPEQVHDLPRAHVDSTIRQQVHHAPRPKLSQKTLPRSSSKDLPPPGTKDKNHTAEEASKKKLPQKNKTLEQKPSAKKLAEKKQSQESLEERRLRNALPELI